MTDLLKNEIRNNLIARPSQISSERVSSELANLSVISDADSIQRIATEIWTELEGLGPLASLIKPGVTDVLVNGVSNIWCDGDAGLHATNVKFESLDQLTSFTTRLLTNAGARIDLSIPRADAVLSNGIRVSALLPPVVVGEPVLALRIPRTESISLDTWATPNISVLHLRDLLTSKLNIVISGQTGSGKTTLLKSFLRELSATDRVVTIEDQPELAAVASHQISLVSRSPNLEGVGEVSLGDLLRQSLRLRPDRIVIGELRGPEVLIWLQAINTGHDGSLTTVHANSAADSIQRLRLLTLLAGVSADVGTALVNQMVDVVLHCERGKDGRYISQLLPVSIRGQQWQSQI